MRTGIVNLPLHGGKAPYWLFEKMKRLSREIIILIVSEHGPREFLHRISDPLWFQAFGCVLGFDWHSSGLTTTVCGAIKEAIKGLEKDLGFFVAGGKGKTSRKTPQEIETAANTTGIDYTKLVYNSKIVAKVDSSALQDGYQLYHHCFLFTQDGKDWAVVQQGMNEDTRLARRYHWLSKDVVDFVCEPHSAICCDQKGIALNLVAMESKEAREAITFLSNEKPDHVLKDLKKIKEYIEYIEDRKYIIKDTKEGTNYKKYTLPTRHFIKLEDIDQSRFEKILISTYQIQPNDFETLLSIKGVGPKTIRALALIAEMVYGANYSIKDPVRFSFAHGGKDGHPYPVDRENYNRSIEILHQAIKESKVGRTEKIDAIRRLANFYG